MASAVTISPDGETLRVSWANGVTVRFAGLPGQRVRGIRDVVIGGVPLRGADKLWRPLVSTPDGIVYPEFILREAVPHADGAVELSCAAHGYRHGLREEQDEYLGDLVELYPNDAPIVDEFSWLLAPSALEVGGRQFVGFSYRYRFQASDPARRLWRIFDDATWEIGGHLTGNTLYLQGQLNPPVTRLTPETFFTTACNYYGAEMKGLMGPAERVSFQRLPRMATLQAFDFLAHDRGVMFARFEPLVDVMTIVQTTPGEDLLHVVDELRRPLAAELVTHPKHLLFHATSEPLAEPARRDLWCRAYDLVHDECRAQHGIKPSPVLPRVWIPQVGGEQYQFGAASGPRERFLYHLADAVLPGWAAMGVKEICTHSLWVSDYTVDRFARKEDSGMHGALFVSGICCVRVHELDTLWGGPAGVAYFVKRAHELGMTVQLWYATHLSRRAPIFAEHPDFMLLARDGTPNGGGFGKHVLITMDLANPECFAWEYAKLKAVYEATGIDGLFHDSYGNMTFLPSSYGQAQRLGQQEAYGRLVRRLQDLGLTSFTVEGLGPWGVGHFGMGLVAGETPHRYQNALDWWLGEEDMLYRLNMGVGTPLWRGREDAAWQFAFRCVAGGGRFGFTTYRDGLEHWEGELRELNRVHARVAPVGGLRLLLPDDQGVLWQTGPNQRLLFAFKSVALPLAAGERAWRVGPERDEAVATGQALAAVPWTVYRLHRGR